MTILGCIADDFTGGADVAAGLRRSGLSVTLLFGTPSDQTPPPTTDAVVIALKSRTAPADQAVAESLACLTWLQAHHVERFYFKYCSTFDSTPAGNIGPVTDALLTTLGEGSTLICPASPGHGRTVYQGHLFVLDQLLSDTSMKSHPLTPMTDPLITRFLQQQTPGAVGLLPLQVVQKGEEAVRAELAELTAHHVRHVVVDAVCQEDLRTVAVAAWAMRLMTGGAGLAAALGQLLTERGETARAPHTELPSGAAVVLAGSCSAATLGQVAKAATEMPSYRLDALADGDGRVTAERAKDWLRANIGRAPLLLYSSAPAEARSGAASAAEAEIAEQLEDAFGALAVEAVAHGATRIVVAGGETSGAVVQALGVTGVVVGDEADPGVPWCLATDRPLALLLKSGNFGGPDLLVRAATETGR